MGLVARNDLAEQPGKLNLRDHPVEQSTKMTVPRPDAAHRASRSSPPGAARFRTRSRIPPRSHAQSGDGYDHLSSRSGARGNPGIGNRTRFPGGHRSRGPGGHREGRGRGMAASLHSRPVTLGRLPTWALSHRASARAHLARLRPSSAPSGRPPSRRFARPRAPRWPSWPCCRRC